MILENNIKQNLLNNNDQKGSHDYDNVNNHAAMVGIMIIRFFTYINY